LGKNGKEHAQWYGHVLQVGGNRGPKVILTGGRKEGKEQEDPKKWEREMAIAMKQEYTHLKTQKWENCRKATEDR
jgi:hypothetical protein